MPKRLGLYRGDGVMVGSGAACELRDELEAASRQG